ncbi:MAG: RDD family protein, partial [Mycobacterium sp.]
QAELARQFLSRASQLDPQIRDQMAHRIAGDVVARISPPPPPGVPPQYVLAAVLAERHRRELDRLRPAPAEPTPPPQWGPPPQWTPPAQWAPPPMPAQPVTPPASYDGGGFAPPS